MEAKDIKFNFDRSGEVYFIRERDVISGELSKYTKIGLVGDRRGGSEGISDSEEDEDLLDDDLEPVSEEDDDLSSTVSRFEDYRLQNSLARLKEHQTGNPQKLTLDESVPAVHTNCVSATEKALHYRFAHLRVRGEWFMLSDQELESAIKLAKKMALDLNEHEQIFRQAMALASLDSTEEVLTPDVELKGWYEDFKVEEKRLKTKVARASAIENQIAAAMTGAIELEGVAVWTYNKPSTRFARKRFLDEHPEFKDALIGDKRTQTLRLKGALKAEESNQKKISSVFSGSDEDRLKVVKRDRDIQDLHQEYLQLLKEINELEWKRTINKDFLRTKFGDAKEILGIASWKRETNQKVLSNNAKTHLQSIGRLDLIQEFTDPVPESYSFKVLPMRPYPTN